MEHICIVNMINIRDFDPFNAWTTASLPLILWKELIIDLFDSYAPFFYSKQLKKINVKSYIGSWCNTITLVKWDYYYVNLKWNAIFLFHKVFNLNF